MKAVIGVGNPGKKYDGTRHNIGFEALDELKNRLKAAAEWSEKKSLKASVVVLDEAVLAKPLTFVNLSGEAVVALIKKYGVKTEALLVVCDDVNLDFGKIRLRESGSAGGHHGLESMIQLLGSEMFPRLRLGVRNERMPEDLSDFVLGRFTKKEAGQIPTILENAAQVCQTWVEEGFSRAMMRLSQLQSNKDRSKE